MNHVGIYLLAILFIVLAFILNKNYSKLLGKAGEYWVKSELKKLPKDKYLILNDIMIESDNRTHQIDHIVISDYGIFVIETKQYNGYITGGEYDKNWVKKIGRNIYYFQNPIRQNYGHLVALNNTLKIEFDKLISIVCIPSRARVKVNVKSHVTRIYNLMDTIKMYNNPIIENKIEIFEKLKDLNINNRKIRKKHVDYIARNVIKDNSNICPSCGHLLIEKNGKYGEFIGYSNYPRCKYKRRI